MRKMLKEIWQRLFGSAVQPVESETTPTQRKLLPPLEDADYQMLFTQLLEGVSRRGWDGERVLKFLSDLGDRGSYEQWAAWLRRYGERFLAAPAANPELARGLLKLGQTGCGELGDVAYEMGSQLLQREIKPPAPPPETAEAWWEQGNEQLGAGDVSGAIASYEQALQRDPELVAAWLN
jgi:tetratricopeptide (TPR) repeat protein